MDEEQTNAKPVVHDADEVSTTTTQCIQQENPWQNSTPEHNQSANSLTYYLSSFDLFENTNPAFLKYRRFIRKLQHYLGSDWIVYANQVVYQQVNDHQRLYLDNQAIFEACLEIWLQMRREFGRKQSIDQTNEQSMVLEEEEEEKKEGRRNSESSTGEGSAQKLLEINFSMFEENEMFEQFSSKFAAYFSLYVTDPMTQKPVLHGFFLSAIETWNYILRNPAKIRPRSDSFKQVFDDYKKKIIKPIMVVSQKLTGIFTQKKQQVPQQRQLNEQTNSNNNQHASNEMNGNLLRSFSNFTQNINNEEEMLEEKMKQLQIKESSATTTTTNINTIKNTAATDINPTNSVTVKKINGLGEKPLDSAIMKFAQQYLHSIVSKSEKQWQVARGFVTSIIEVKYNNLQEYANNMKIRFLQPAQEFYNSLLDTYILFKSNNYTNISFKDFLEKTKMNLGSKWSENLILPTQVFFQTLILQWNSILEENQNANKDDETIIRLFVQRVRTKMADSWDENIVKKAQEGIED